MLQFGPKNDAIFQKKKVFTEYQRFFRWKLGDLKKNKFKGLHGISTVFPVEIRSSPKKKGRYGNFNGFFGRTWVITKKKGLHGFTC